MSLKEAIDAIIARMKTVPGVGQNVHDSEISLTDRAEFEAAFVEKDKQRINGWTVLVETTQSTDKGIGAVDDVHQIVIRGFRSFSQKAKSGAEFRDDVEAIRLAFNKGDRTLGGACLQSRAMSRRTQTSGMLANYLVHYVELTYPVRVYP